MFTGIIEELGTVTHIKTVKDSQELKINCNKILSDISLGDSIAINGVCLTVTTFDDKCFCVDVMPETYKSTSLSRLKTNVKVNLERALAVGGRLGGHFVSGHVDGVGEITSITKNNNAWNYGIRLDKELLKYCLLKGSIAVDGTSLTIFEIGDDFVGISLIPHTVTNSILGQKKVGDIVNIECDMLGKYAINLLQSPNNPNGSVLNHQSKINVDFLQQQGFM